ncbi:hypothetical protein ASD82_05480 [Rhodanobacter sp. Root179]|nr:hypothetical protein ASD82_05480 [Rhodanobacter sp. Root179]
MLATYLVVATSAAFAATPEVEIHRMPSNADYQTINRCTHAAHIALLALEQHPESRDARQNAALQMQKWLIEDGKLGDDAPQIPEIVMTLVSVETLLEKGQGPSTNQMREWFAGQAAVTCAVSEMP